MALPNRDAPQPRPPLSTYPTGSPSGVYFCSRAPNAVNVAFGALTAGVGAITEHALARMLHELSDANLVALHADGGVSVAVSAADLKDTLRTCMRRS